MRTKRWRTYLETVQDALDWEVQWDRGAVVFFSINYRTFRDDDWLEVCRYDTCHGFLHIHRFWRELADQAEELFSPKIPVRNYRAAFAAAADDLLAHWQKYKRLRLLKKRGEPTR